MGSDPDLPLSWFEPDELTDCLQCGAHSVVTTAISSVCMECGHLQVLSPP
jgi:hypothetical protein